MRLTINGELKKIEADRLTVSALLAAENVEMPDMVSVELNDVMVDRAEFSSQSVVDNDRVEFLYFMGGGT